MGIKISPPAFRVALSLALLERDAGRREAAQFAQRTRPLGAPHVLIIGRSLFDRPSRGNAAGR